MRRLARLHGRLPHCLVFVRADTATGDKSLQPLAWFEHLAHEREADAMEPAH